MKIPKEIAERYEIKHLERPRRCKKTPEPCEGCSKLVVDRRVEYRLYKGKKRVASHWRIKCMECAMYYNPKTDKWNLHNTPGCNYNLSTFYESFYKKDK
jgi:hypothetical protein